MFLSNKYTKWYYNIINNAKNQQRIKLKRTDINYIYYEKHHIIPRCMNGTNDLDNLILLTAKEHYICHVLLCKMVDKSYEYYKKIINAYIQMSRLEKRKITSKLYENIRKEFSYNRSLAMSGKNNPMYGLFKNNHPTYGRKHTEEAKEKIRENMKNNNPMYGKKHTEEAKEKISKGTKLYNKNNSRIITDETKRKLSKALKGKFSGKNNPMYGKKHTEDAKKKMAIKNWSPEGLERLSNFAKNRSPLFKGRKHTEETKEKIREKRKDQVITDETKRKLSKALKGMKWWNNGIKNIRALECPGPEWNNKKL